MIRTLLIGLFGGALFTVLSWQAFGVPFIKAALVGFPLMSSVAYLDHVVPRRFTLAFAALAGALIGMALWWLFPFDLPWYIFSGPLALLALGEAWIDRVTPVPDREEPDEG